MNLRSRPSLLVFIWSIALCFSAHPQLKEHVLASPCIKLVVWLWEMQQEYKRCKAANFGEATGRYDQNIVRDYCEVFLTKYSTIFRTSYDKRRSLEYDRYKPCITSPECVSRKIVKSEYVWGWGKGRIETEREERVQTVGRSVCLAGAYHDGMIFLRSVITSLT